ncbi:Myc-type, basic helix-loop-helix domain-containing protein [Tanacetum coccineum]
MIRLNFQTMILEPKYSPRHIFQDDYEFRRQFSCGMKVLLFIISYFTDNYSHVEPQGVVQFGSIDKILETVEFVNQTKSMFQETLNLGGSEVGLTSLDGQTCYQNVAFASFISPQESFFTDFGIPDEFFQNGNFPPLNPIDSDGIHESLTFSGTDVDLLRNSGDLGHILASFIDGSHSERLFSKLGIEELLEGIFGISNSDSMSCINGQVSAKRRKTGNSKWEEVMPISQPVGKSTLNGFGSGVFERIVIDFEQPAEVDERNRRKQQVRNSVSDNLEEMRAREKHRALDMWKNHETPEQTLPPWLTAKPFILPSQRLFNKTEMADANNTHVFKKVKTDDSRNVTKILGVSISDPKFEKKESVLETRHYIDLNMSYNKEEAAPSFSESVMKIATMEIDLVAPAVLESNSDDGSNDIHMELVKVAAEDIVSISISQTPCEPSVDTLLWLAHVITSKDCKESSVHADKEYVPEDMDYFEYMTLKLKDTEEKYDDFKPMISCLNTFSSESGLLSIVGFWVVVVLERLERVGLGWGNVGEVGVLWGGCLAMGSRVYGMVVWLVCAVRVECGVDMGGVWFVAGGVYVERVVVGWLVGVWVMCEVVGRWMCVGEVVGLTWCGVIGGMVRCGLGGVPLVPVVVDWGCGDSEDSRTMGGEGWALMCGRALWVELGLGEVCEVLGGAMWLVVFCGCMGLGLVSGVRLGFIGWASCGLFELRRWVLRVWNDAVLFEVGLFCGGGVVVCGRRGGGGMVDCWRVCVLLVVGVGKSEERFVVGVRLGCALSVVYVYVSVFFFEMLAVKVELGLCVMGVSEGRGFWAICVLGYWGGVWGGLECCGGGSGDRAVVCVRLGVRGVRVCGIGMVVSAGVVLCVSGVEVLVFWGGGGVCGGVAGDVSVVSFYWVDVAWGRGCVMGGGGVEWMCGQEWWCEGVGLLVCFGVGGAFVVVLGLWGVAWCVLIWIWLVGGIGRVVAGWCVVYLMGWGEWVRAGSAVGSGGGRVVPWLGGVLVRGGMFGVWVVVKDVLGWGCGGLNGLLGGGVVWVEMLGSSIGVGSGCSVVTAGGWDRGCGVVVVCVGVGRGVFVGVAGCGLSGLGFGGGDCVMVGGGWDEGCYVCWSGMVGLGLCVFVAWSTKGCRRIGLMCCLWLVVGGVLRLLEVPGGNAGFVGDGADVGRMGGWVVLMGGCRVLRVADLKVFLCGGDGRVSFGEWGSGVECGQDLCGENLLVVVVRVGIGKCVGVDGGSGVCGFVCFGCGIGGVVSELVGACCVWGGSRMYGEFGCDIFCWVVRGDGMWVEKVFVSGAWCWWRCVGWFGFCGTEGVVA